MPSDALRSLLDGIQEVRDLQAANPTPPGGLPDLPRVVRAINRGSVVLLCSHLERYLRNVNEEAVAAVNQAPDLPADLPKRLRLQHSRIPIENLSETGWENRANQLSQLVANDGWLWGNSPKADLKHDRLLRWMRSPSPERIRRLFELWDVRDVFSKVTRRPATKQRMWLRLDELVNKRNDISHGDADIGATYQDIASYVSVVGTFCQRADRVLSRAIARHLGASLPW